MYVCRRRMPPRRSESGAVAVEFALIVPLLAALLLAMTTGGVAFSQYVSLNDAVRVGARVGATTASDSSWAQKVRDATIAATGATELSKVCAQLVKVVSPGSGSVPPQVVDIWSPTPGCDADPPEPPMGPPGTPLGLTTGDCVVKVWAQQKVIFINYYLPDLLNNNKVTIKRSAVSRYERPCVG